MTIKIELDLVTEAQLAAEARNHGLELAAFAEDILKSAATLPGRKPTATPEQIRAMFDAFDKLAPKELPLDDQGWSRDIIYGEHP